MYKLTTFELFFNTPLGSFTDTIHFTSIEARDSFFSSNVYKTYRFPKQFNFIKTSNTVQLSITWDKAQGYNYGRFKSELDDNIWYYFRIADKERPNGSGTLFSIIIDPIMTFCQGNRLMDLRNVNITRQHLPQAEYDELLPRLRNNDDILSTYTKKYQLQKREIFNPEEEIQIPSNNDNFEHDYGDGYVNYVKANTKEMACILYASQDLWGISDLFLDAPMFGSEDAPRLVAPVGQTYDNNTSPMNLYVTTKQHFLELSNALREYPWIVQCIQKVAIIPFKFLDTNDMLFKNYKIKTGGEGAEEENSEVVIGKFKQNGKSQNFYLDKTITETEMLSVMGITEEDRHLLRQGYTTLENYSADGQQVLLDVNLLPSEGLRWRAYTCIGYHNQVAIYPINYNSGQYESGNPDEFNSGVTLVDRGSFLNNSFLFNKFDEMPVMLDNGLLAKANSAYTRSLAESRLTINRVKDLAMGNGNANDRQQDLFSILGSFGSGTSQMVSGGLSGNPGAFGSGIMSTGGSFIKAFTEEYNFYQNQEAQFKEMALATPTISAQTTGNAFAIANNIYGINMKFSCPDRREVEKLQRYHRLRGFDISEIRYQLSDINSMSMMNFVQFTCPTLSSMFDDVQKFDPRLVPLMSIIFENGLKLWHNDDSPLPMNKDIMQNRRVR